jgi:hypothetical protein
MDRTDYQTTIHTGMNCYETTRLCLIADPGKNKL